MHLQVVSTKNGFMHISHAESLSPLSSNHVDLQTIPTLENFCTTPLFVSTSPEIRPLPSVSLHAHLQVVSIRKVLAHSSHAEALSSVGSDHVDLQTLPT